ncbi:MAG TPA: hypothetical protein VIL53_07250 [Solirubrobacterales bacterium]
MSNSTSCSVCGRTILKGERTRTYLTPDGDRRIVCELCRARAEALHWVWAEVANEHRPVPSPRRPRGSLSGWLRGRAKRRAEPDAQPAGASVPPPQGNGSQEPVSTSRSGPPDPAARGARVGRAGAIPEPGTRIERAVSRFNESEHARTVAGLTRTLGQPQVSVGAAAGSPNEIRLTVAWELSWYQWGVDLGEPSRAVYEIDKGHEVSEIDASAREWNAHAAEGGSLRLGTVPAEPEGEPAGTES